MQILSRRHRSSGHRKIAEMSASNHSRDSVGWFLCALNPQTRIVAYRGRLRQGLQHLREAASAAVDALLTALVNAARASAAPFPDVRVEGLESRLLFDALDPHTS